jgi:glycosyltransferase involved in cell wall biosynthesis
MGAIPKWTGAKLILDIHDVIPEFYCQKFNNTMDSGLAKFLLFLENRSVRFADYVIVANDIWKDKIILRNNLKNNCSALLNYPSLQFYRPKEKTETNDGSAFNLIYPGTLSFQHGIDILVRAMAIVRNSGEKIHLHIYTLPASGDFRNEMDRLIEELRVSDVIFFHDSVPPDLLGEIIGKSDAGVVPKRGGIFAGEAFSTKIFDFMAAGIPVVASKTKIDTYYFDESIVKFFHPEDHEDLAKAILELRRDPERRKRMAKNGIKYIEENNWENKKQIYLDIVDDLLGNMNGMSKA